MIMYLFLATLAISGTFCTGLGLLTVYYWVKPANKPADISNRINNISSWWIGLTRPEVLATSYEYFRQDVMENVESVQSNKDTIAPQENHKGSD